MGQEPVDGETRGQVPGLVESGVPGRSRGRGPAGQAPMGQVAKTEMQQRVSGYPGPFFGCATLTRVEVHDAATRHRRPVDRRTQAPAGGPLPAHPGGEWREERMPADQIEATLPVFGRRVYSRARMPTLARHG